VMPAPQHPRLRSSLWGWRHLEAWGTVRSASLRRYFDCGRRAYPTWSKMSMRRLE